MNDDAELLCRYAEEGSETAFAELVHRHVDLVYGAAMRRTGGDPHRAAEVAQQVFTTLARDARKLSRHAVLPAWLHTATRNAALNLMIAEKRRQVRETQAMTLAAASTDEIDPDWNTVRPLLDRAIDELPEADRTAVILRFLERQPFAEIGAVLQVSEDAARVRTDRALEKLRVSLTRRGVTSTAAALGALVLAQPVSAAPTGLATTLAVHAMSAAGPGAVVTLTSLMKTKIIVTAVVGALVLFSVGSYVGFSRGLATTAANTKASAAAASDADAALIASLRRKSQELSDRIIGLNSELAQLTEANAQLKAQIMPANKPKSPTLGLAKWEAQRMMMSSLRQIDAARKKYKQEHGTAPASINDLVGRRNYIKAVRTVSGEDYSGLSMEDGAPLTVTTPDGSSFTYDPSGATTTPIEVPAEVAHAEQLGAKMQPLIQKAVAGYQAAHNGGSPPNPQALLAFFPTPEDAADFSEYLEAQKAANAIGP